MVMSSKRAGHRAFMELLGLIDQALTKGTDIVFRKYSEMRLRRLSRSGYYKKLKRLESQGLIESRRDGSQRVFVITAKAKALRKRPATKKFRADGFASLVIFDVPEEKHNARDTLRRFLIRNGYTQLRESCFISPFEISNDLKDLTEELKLEKNVSFFSAKPEYFFNKTV